MKPILGTLLDGERTPLPIDLDVLIETRLLIQANSGGGKSWIVRRTLEQTHSQVQHLVLDVDDEFHTLREKHDYVLAGRAGGDCPATVKSAALLARRLLELGVSAIIGLYELRHDERELFVKHFLNALIEAPRSLWKPVLVVIDEAHKFCPEVGKVESSAAVIDLMTRGRKRGFCGVLATQRIAKLHKDAAAECNNKLIGRTGLDVDQDRAAKELGFRSAADREGLRDLDPGVFYAYGPALCRQVQAVKIGPVFTTHPKVGQRAAAPPPATTKVKKILAQLVDLPAEAAAEAATVAELQARIRQLEAGLRAKPVAPAAPAPKVVDRPVMSDADWKRVEAIIEKATVINTSIQGFVEKIATIRQPALAQRPVHAPAQRVGDVVHVGKHQLQVRTGNLDTELTPVLPKGEATILAALIQYPAGLDRGQLTVITGYKRSTRNAYIQRLIERGYVHGTNHVVATPAGFIALPDAQPLPTGIDLQVYWCNKLPAGEEAILRALIAAYPQDVSRDEITVITGYKRSTRNAYIQRMLARQVVEEPTRDTVRAVKELF